MRESHMLSTTEHSSVPLLGDLRSASGASGAPHIDSSAQNNPVATPYFSSIEAIRESDSASSFGSAPKRHSTAADLSACGQALKSAAVL